MVDRRGHKRRGIDPVVATLILLIISVIAGVAIYSFFTGFFGSFGISNPGKIVITATGVDGNHTNVAISNIGSSNITIPVDDLVILVDGQLKCTGEITDGRRRS